MSIFLCPVKIDLTAMPRVSEIIQYRSRDEIGPPQFEVPVYFSTIKH